MVSLLISCSLGSYSCLSSNGQRTLGQSCHPPAPASAFACLQSKGLAVTSMAALGSAAAGAELSRSWFWSVLSFVLSHHSGSVHQEESKMKGSEHTGEGAVLSTSKAGTCFSQDTECWHCQLLCFLPLHHHKLWCYQSLPPVPTGTAQDTELCGFCERSWGLCPRGACLLDLLG